MKFGIVGHSYTSNKDSSVIKAWLGNLKGGSGKVVKMQDGIVGAVGLDAVCMGELVEIGSKKIKGMVLSLEEGNVSIAIFGEERGINVGHVILRTRKVMRIPLHTKLFGRTIDALGNSIDRGPKPVGFLSRIIDTKALGITGRTSICEPVQTGIMAIDALTPIGRGQRELIIGDRQTGKTTIGVDSIISQKNSSDLQSVYVAIGQRKAVVAKLVKRLKKFGVLESSIIVCASCGDPATLQYLAGYSGCTLGEWIGESGLGSLVIYDDLTKQAVAYRQMSLLLRRPPGREAYPGDVFYLHSRLLERAAKWCYEKGAGSFTALPIIETQAGDVSAYIPTNVISITDGQVFLESKLFNEGIRPAINVGLSVSRVGSAAQVKGMKEIAGSLKLSLALYREVEAFVSFASELEAETKFTIYRGLQLIEILKQKCGCPIPTNAQVFIIYATLNGYLENILREDVYMFKNLLKYLVLEETNIWQNFSEHESICGYMFDFYWACLSDAYFRWLEKNDI